MPRKDKKSKKPKKPKVPQKVQTLRPPKLKPCIDCGYKTGSAFTVPFGFADRLGTRRLEAPIAPVVNINLGDYFKSDLPKKPIAKKEISIQTEAPLDYVKMPLKTPSDFEMETIYKQKPEDIFISPYDIYNEPFLNVTKSEVKKPIPSAVAEPFQFPSPFGEVEGAYITEAEAEVVKPKRQYIRKTPEEREAEKNRPRRKYTKKQG
jgi:hypothetical protein